MCCIVSQNGVGIENIKVQLQACGRIFILSIAPSFEMLTNVMSRGGTNLPKYIVA
jgi:hypothetical protein